MKGGEAAITNSEQKKAQAAVYLPKIVFLDLNLPSVDDKDFLELIKED